jgi:L-proline cis-4-hydroxylase
MTRTRRLAQINLDSSRLGEDLARSDRFRFSDAYSEFTCGSWKGSALVNQSGDLYDTRVKEYEGPHQVTEHGRQMPYVLETVERYFKTENLRFVRLGRVTPGSVMVPHRDYLELKGELVRIHIPLCTSDACFSSDDETIYQMRLGDVWYIDATHAHSAVSFATHDRTHLILDFADEALEDSLGFTPEEHPDGDAFGGASVGRAPLTDAQRDALMGLCAIISPRNYRDVLALIIKQYFVSKITVTEIFDLACQIAETAGQQEALENLRWLRTHALVTRLD